MLATVYQDHNFPQNILPTLNNSIKNFSLHIKITIFLKTLIYQMEISRRKISFSFYISKQNYFELK